MKKALIVGLNKYPGCELACCSNDAVAMKELIESNGDGSPNFDVVAITDSCTKKNLKIHIEKLFADDADIALLYFSGHGADCDGGYLKGNYDYLCAFFRTHLPEIWCGL